MRIPVNVRAIVGLYLNPPDHAVVPCVDEKSQVLALDRMQKALPMDLGYVEGCTHDSIRHGTTTLFAALHSGTGRLIDKVVPSALDSLPGGDNYVTHEHASVQAWPARRPGFQPCVARRRTRPGSTKSSAGSDWSARRSSGAAVSPA